MGLSSLLRDVFLLVCCFAYSVFGSSFPWMYNDCGLEFFEKDTSLDGYVYTVYKIGSMNTPTALACVMDCFYDRTCMSVVYQQQSSVCHMYLTHMKDTYPKVTDGTASYVQFKDPNDCPAVPVCDPNAACINKRDNDTCHCNDGYSGDGQTCSDADECLTGSHTCDVNADCTNNIGSFSCACQSGFSGDGYSCIDVDECATAAHDCDVNAECTNTHGSFTCQCKNMYQGTGQVCTLKQIRGEACNVDADCIRANFMCSSNMCDCDLSYSYNGTSNTCETKCDEYGTEFTMQSSPYCITGNNDDYFYISTASGCKVKCLEANFTCRTFELWSQRCWLSTKVKLDVPESSWDPWSGCQYYQRHCA